MLSIVLNWLYIAFTTFCLGYGFAVLIDKTLKYRLKRVDSLLMAGIIIATVYAQIFSLVTKVGLLANIIMVLVCVAICILCRKSLFEFIKNAASSCSLSKWIIIAVLVALWAYFTSRGEIHIDTDLYHAQSIRWIEEYGVVPGLGNLHERFAYNSSSFALNALYSMKFFLGQSLHTISGFFALLLSMTAVDITKSRKRQKFVLSDYARLAAVYYLTTITDEVVSPASDYSIMCMIFFIVIKWLDLLAEKEKNIAPYALLCVAGVYALTLKLTAGLILLLVIKPAYMLIKEKRWKEIAVYLGMGLLVAIPWFARTVVISGWLLYPFPALDLFNVDWKMDAELIAIDAAQISAWGRALYNVGLLDTPLSEWLTNWFVTTLSGTEKILVLGDMCCILLYIAGIVLMLLKKSWKHWDFALVLGAVICSYLFWQLSAPLMRYGYAYVLLLDFLTVGWLLTCIGWNKVEKLAYFMILIYGIYKIGTIGEYIYGTRLIECYVWQADYGSYEVESYEVGGEIFYKPVSGALTGYDPFPAAPTQAEIELRGNGMKDGFRRK